MDIYCSEWRDGFNLHYQRTWERGFRRLFNFVFHGDSSKWKETLRHQRRIDGVNRFLRGMRHALYSRSHGADLSAYLAFSMTISSQQINKSVLYPFRHQISLLRFPSHPMTASGALDGNISCRNFAVWEQLSFKKIEYVELLQLLEGDTNR